MKKILTAVLALTLYATATAQVSAVNYESCVGIAIKYNFKSWITVPVPDTYGLWTAVGVFTEKHQKTPKDNYLVYNDKEGHLSVLATFDNNSIYWNEANNLVCYLK
ncbi:MULTISPECIES: hypothetical protein [Deinococcus]|uniref:Uncharacterized protein n=1 Tax=Deinococcus rufus TaxID=2136097 RepID=A0ABV7Z8N3_9DEIO|nr:hypothetical protein [Deinococcus sp. AB2017081]WQE94412.1 hypothetical protein U2P90_13485 [Deinococcus sp. AB2017081]